MKLTKHRAKAIALRIIIGYRAWRLRRILTRAERFTHNDN